MTDEAMTRLKAIVEIAKTARANKHTIFFFSSGDAEALASAVVEIERLREVIKTHDLCHDLHGKVDARAFADGCAAEQRKLYGEAPDADEIARLRAEVKRLQAEKEDMRQRNKWLRDRWDLDCDQLRKRERYAILERMDKAEAECRALRSAFTKACIRDAVERAVASGVQHGLTRADKHTSAPLTDAQRDRIRGPLVDEVMNELDGLISLYQEEL